MLPLFDGNEGDVVFALLGKLHIDDNGTSISVSTLLLLKKKKKKRCRDFPDSPVFKTLYFYCRGHAIALSLW